MPTVRVRAYCEVAVTDHAMLVHRYGRLVNEQIWAAGGEELDDAAFAERYGDVVAACMREAGGDRPTLVRLLVDAADREPL